LFNANGVIKKLDDLPEYHDEALELKRKTTYEFFSRPTISWNLTCETTVNNPITR